MNRSRWLLAVAVDDSNVAKGFVSPFFAVLVLVVMVTCVAVASDPAPPEAESAQTFEVPTGSKADFADELKSRIRDRYAFYDPSRGTQPTEQGFRLLDNARGHANPQVTAGVLKQGPTTTTGYQRWYTAAIPIDFSAEGKGTAVEWTAQVKRSGLYIDRLRKREWTGWGVQLQDKNGYTFDIYLGEDRVLLNRDDGNMPIATHKLDTTDRFHHYRFVIDDSQGMLFIDGSLEPAVVGKVGSPNQSRYSKPNEVAFGDCTTNAFSEVHVKGLWYASNAQAKSPFYVAPKPPTALLYDASRGTLPGEQGFQLVDDDPNHAPVCIEAGKLIDGPTTTKGMRYWQSHRIPLDFRPQGSGLSAEWKIQVVDSRVDSTDRYSGWSASFVDRFGHQFLVGLGNERIVLHNMTGDPKPAFVQFNTTESHHHFRFVVDDNQGILYVDGKRLLKKPIGKPDKRKILVNRVLFGDGTGIAGAHTKLLGFGYTSDPRAKSRFHLPSKPPNSLRVAATTEITCKPIIKNRSEEIVGPINDEIGDAVSAEIEFLDLTLRHGMREFEVTIAAHTLGSIELDPQQVYSFRLQRPSDGPPIERTSQ